MIYSLNPPPADKIEDYKLVEMIFMKQVKYGKIISGEHYSKTLPSFEFLNLGMTILDIKKLVY